MLLPNVPKIINVVHHVQKFGALIALLYFILDNICITISLLSQKPLVSVSLKMTLL